MPETAPQAPSQGPDGPRRALREHSSDLSSRSAAHHAQNGSLISASLAVPNSGRIDWSSRIGYIIRVNRVGGGSRLAMSSLLIVRAWRSEYPALAGRVPAARRERRGWGRTGCAWLPRLAELNPGAFVVAGAAGGLDPVPGPGDVVVASEVGDEHSPTLLKAALGEGRYGSITTWPVRLFGSRCLPEEDVN
jgi:hypothetical protein